MSTKIILEIESGLASEEAEFVKQLLRDAIGEFITARSGRGSDRRVENTPDPHDATVEYVRKRYPDLSVEAHLQKVDEVRARKAIARKLRRAVDDMKIENDEALPIRERTCEVLPTIFGSSVEDEAKAQPKGPKQTQCTPCQGLGSIELTGQRCRVCGGSGWVKTKK
jgi:hypothetical protein